MNSRPPSRPAAACLLERKPPETGDERARLSRVRKSLLVRRIEVRWPRPGRGTPAE